MTYYPHSLLFINMPAITEKSKIRKRAYDMQRYHGKKHTVKHIEYRRSYETAQRKKWRDHCPFRRLAQYQRKRNKANIKAIDLWRLCLRQRGKCALTGRKLTIENMSVDHIVPMIKGGSLNISNLRLTVKEANIAKWTLTDEELFVLCEEILTEKVKRKAQQNEIL